MMYDSEKSDSVTVVTKPMNNIAETVIAELVERRTEIKGKMIEDTTRRTPSRESVSPGLDRLRQRARERRNEKFTALLHHINIDLLSKAYHWLKRDAAAGVDGVTWEAYGVD